MGMRKDELFCWFLGSDGIKHTGSMGTTLNGGGGVVFFQLTLGLAKAILSPHSSTFTLQRGFCLNLQVPCSIPVTAFVFTRVWKPR